ncbi:MAG: hypothetical protein LAP39_19465 [Acidobacteriia bacterium]|nr:hypothetical protein [Terriglobia bacterium]
MPNLRYPVKTMAGMAVAAGLSLYGTFAFYEDQTLRNRNMHDLYHVGEQVQRLAPLNREVAPGTLLGYVTDLNSSEQFVAVQYAVAPRLLVDDPPQGLVLGDFSRSLDYAEFGRQHGLTLMKEFPYGVVLFRKSH